MLSYKPVSGSKKSNCEIWVNGKVLDFDWNSFESIEKAFSFIRNHDIVGVSILRDNVQIVKIEQEKYDVDFFNIGS